ncbi:MAG TPA: DUF1573 domain-containing protein [Pirellulales bacterium]|nr:DUF1573 domain-containing protein [Pirellulales bacterium]
MIRPLLTASLVLFLVGSASAQEWAKKMFETTSHDFGTVAHGAKAEYHFQFTNLYEEELHVSGVGSSCGCTTPECPKPTLTRLEKGEIIAVFNTGTFTGSRHATLTIKFDKPFPAEVQLNITGTIRTDLSMNPNFIDLGQVDRGQTIEKRMQINYAGGRSDWKIMDVLSLNQNLEVEVSPASRGGGQATYSLLVRLKKDAPVGFIKDQLLLVTNEGKGIQIPVDVEGRVVPELTVSPTSLFFGVAQPGQTLTKQIVVKAKKPFTVTDVQCDDPSFSCTLPSEKKALHLIPITFTAGQTGKISQKIRVKTDLNDDSAEITVSAQVTAPPANVAGASN